MEKLKAIPEGYAYLFGSEKYPDIQGKAEFYEVYGGTVVVVEVSGLPKEEKEKNGGFFGFHIHEGNTCTGNPGDLLADTKGHFNPQNLTHPRHVGDLPPLLADQGDAWMSVYTSRFFPEDVIGKTVVIHNMPDDFRSQPSGDSGEKIACGQIIMGEEDER